MHNDMPATILAVAVTVCGFLLVGAAIFGYIANIWKLCAMNWDSALTILGVLRMVGVVIPPLGAIVGWA